MNQLGNIKSCQNIKRHSYLRKLSKRAHKTIQIEKERDPFEDHCLFKMVQSTISRNLSTSHTNDLLYDYKTMEYQNIMNYNWQGNQE